MGIARTFLFSVLLVERVDWRVWEMAAGGISTIIPHTSHYFAVLFGFNHRSGKQYWMKIIVMRKVRSTGVAHVYNGHLNTHHHCLDYHYSSFGLTVECRVRYTFNRIESDNIKKYLDILFVRCINDIQN